MAPYLKNYRVLGLGEVMDCMAVINGDVSMNEKSSFDGKIKDGHAPNLSDLEIAPTRWPAFRPITKEQHTTMS